MTEPSSNKAVVPKVVPKVVAKVVAKVVLGLALASLLVYFSQVSSDLPSPANLDLSIPGLKECHIRLIPSEPKRCWLDESFIDTMARTAPPRKRAKYTIQLSPCKSPTTRDLPIFCLRSKRRGTIIFIPCPLVDDWYLPFWSESLEGLRPELDLPALAWTSLFFEGRYAGLYLKFSPPFDKRRSRGGPAHRRALVSFNGKGEGIALCTRFQWPSETFRRALANGSFPGLDKSKADSALLALYARTSRKNSCYLLAESSVSPCQPLPLPFSLAEIHRRLYPSVAEKRLFQDPRLPAQDAKVRERAQALSKYIDAETTETREDAQPADKRQMFRRAYWRRLDRARKLMARVRGVAIPRPNRPNQPNQPHQPNRPNQPNQPNQPKQSKRLRPSERLGAGIE